MDRWIMGSIMNTRQEHNISSFNACSGSHPSTCDAGQPLSIMCKAAQADIAQAPTQCLTWLLLLSVQCERVFSIMDEHKLAF
jgi:hypothetical protein